MLAIELLVACTYWVYPYFAYWTRRLSVPLRIIAPNAIVLLLLYFLSFVVHELDYFIPYVAGWRIEV
jgi:hypothetical protein